MCVYGVPYSTVVVAGPNESIKMQRERNNSSILYLKCALPVSKIRKDLSPERNTRFSGELPGE